MPNNKKQMLSPLQFRLYQFLYCLLGLNDSDSINLSLHNRYFHHLKRPVDIKREEEDEMIKLAKEFGEFTPQRWRGNIFYFHSIYQFIKKKKFEKR
jgi:hypothetical protein